LRDGVEVRARLAEVLLQEGERSFRSRPVLMPSRPIFAAVAGPTPWNFETSRSSTKAGPISGVMTNCPSGLRRPEASLARNLL